MTDEEEKLTLRDRFALEMFKIIAQDKVNTASSMHDFVNFFESKDKDRITFQKDNEKRIERSMRAAYKLADLMRKARLGVFE